MVKNIAVLGSTGSIGVNTLEVVALHPDRFRVVSLVAGGNWQRLVKQAQQFNPEVVAIYDSTMHAKVDYALSETSIRVLSGKEGVRTASMWETSHLVVSAIVGAAGLEPTLAAIQAGKDIALANKECLVMAGSLFMQAVSHHNVRLIPVDSEHSAIFQVLFNASSEAGQGGRISLNKGVRKLILTASGGPFRGWSSEMLKEVTPETALNHPKWDMGPKISIDSATLMNKGLEVIEAHYLFAVEAENIQVVVHPESIVHSLVSYEDGSVLAQLGVPDMRTPIAVALGWPERIHTTVPSLDLASVGQLNFFPVPEKQDFPCLNLAYEALQQGEGMTAVLNAANEVAVANFLKGKIRFLDIPRLIEHTMQQVSVRLPESVDEVLHIDREARNKADHWVLHHEI